MLTPPEWAKNANYAALVYFKAGPRVGGWPMYGRNQSFGRDVRHPEQLELKRLRDQIEEWRDKLTTAEIYDMKDGQRLVYKFTNGRWVL